MHTENERRADGEGKKGRQAGRNEWKGEWMLESQTTNRKKAEWEGKEFKR